MVERTEGSIYWRKLGAFQWLDHREWGYELGLSGWTELTGRGRESLFGLYGMKRRMLGGLCGVVGGWTAVRGVATPTGRVAVARAGGGRRCRRWAKLGPKQKQARRLDGPHD
jgi:hypothetical protein